MKRNNFLFFKIHRINIWILTNHNEYQISYQIRYIEMLITTSRAPKIHFITVNYLLNTQWIRSYTGWTTRKFYRSNTCKRPTSTGTHSWILNRSDATLLDSKYWNILPLVTYFSSAFIDVIIVNLILLFNAGLFSENYFINDHWIW